MLLYPFLSKGPSLSLSAGDPTDREQGAEAEEPGLAVGSLSGEEGRKLGITSRGIHYTPPPTHNFPFVQIPQILLSF